MPPRRGRKGRADVRSTSSDISTNTNSDLTMPILTPSGANNQTSGVKINIPNIQIQKFDGNPDELNFFINQIKDIARINQWSDDIILAYATANVNGQAKQLISQKLEFTQFESSEHLFEELRNHFTQTSIASHMVEYNNLKMLPNETISNLNHRLDFLANKVYSKVTQNALDEIKFVKFIQVIPPNYRLLILQNNISDYKLAVEKAKLAQECELQNSVFTSTPTTQNDRFSELSEQVNNIQTAINEFKEKSSENKTNFNFHNKRRNHNNFRGRRGNFRGRIFKYNRGNRRNFRQPHRNNYRNVSDNGHNTQAISQESNIVCQLCFCLGHSARECGTAPAINLPHNQNSLPAINHPNYHASL